MRQSANEVQNGIRDHGIMMAGGGSLLAVAYAGVAVEGWLVGHTGEIARTPGISVKTLRADTVRCTPAVERAGTACFAEWLTSVGL